MNSIDDYTFCKEASKKPSLKRRDIKKDVSTKVKRVEKARRKAKKRDHHKSPFYYLPLPEEVYVENFDYDSLLEMIIDEGIHKENDNDKSFLQDILVNCNCCPNHKECKNYDPISANQIY